MDAPAMLARAALLAAACASITACAALRDREPRLVRHVCQAEADGPFGRIAVLAFVSPDGRRVTYSRTWQAEQKHSAVVLRMDWRGASEAPPPETELRIEVAISRARRSWNRLEMRRNGLQGARVYSTSSSNPSFRWLETMRWERFAGLVGDARALHVALVRRDRRIVTEAIWPRAILDAPAAAAAAIRPEVQRMVANPGVGCFPETDPPLVLA